jgi:hypothetical protein
LSVELGFAASFLFLGNEGSVAKAGVAKVRGALVG